MIKRELVSGIVQYMFEPLNGSHFGNCITALIDSNKVLLIDTGYKEQALLVFEDLKSNGLYIEKIIISHFHDDHMQGLKVLPKTTVYGSKEYKSTLDLWTEMEEHKYFIPTTLIEEQVSVDFGKHHLILIPFPGHSLCTVITKIDDQYIHIADELMFSIDGKPLLPSTDPNCIKRHIESLKKLKEYSSYTLLPSHGSKIRGKEKIEKEIDNRIAYFNAIVSSNKKISYEEAIKECDCEFLDSEGHEHVYD
ncbi:MBL fold metallo-hydrolase [Clostridium vincentii]|uniref:Hydroxyacylglutathione hydrolase n=1 Tax=Clostridium vincentii TaxID=52704 RepID=A0A2T0BBD0_9CLOT|nr:MBL fold metallo-hydrolase [Clostridium vincentii]PRR81184.1 Hydroxyacylglutathione hydrolase [Clostridium vincentii]